MISYMDLSRKLRRRVTFINNKNALRIRPETKEVAVIIKYPQPNIEYCLRWNLPKKDDKVMHVSGENFRTHIVMCNRLFDRQNEPKIEELYSSS